MREAESRAPLHELWDDASEVVDALLAGSVITVSSGGAITDWNARAQRAFGIEEDDAIGSSFVEAIAPAEDRGPEERRLAELLGGNYGTLRPQRLRVTARHASGRELDAALVLIPVSLDDSPSLSPLLAAVAAAGDHGLGEEARERYSSVLDRLARALAPSAPPISESQDARVAGVVVIFDAHEVASAPVASAPVVSAPVVELAPPVAVAPPQPTERGPEGHLRAALAEDRFVLCAQPVLQLASNAVVQHELLLRMTGEDGSLLLPRAFLPAAEAAGLMPEIDAWVTRRAIELIAEQEHVGRKLRLEVNLSAEALGAASFALGLEAELASSGIDPSRLVLEISERVAAENVEAASGLSRRARSLGCRFAIDNVGQTFACLRELKHIPVDYLKIDGSLTSGVTESRADRLMLEAIVAIAHGLGASAVAEWVSDVETLALLREAGVDLAQGYRIGRPLPIGEDQRSSGDGLY